MASARRTEGLVPDEDDHERVPRLAEGWDPSGRIMSPAEGFLLSRIDGHTPWKFLLQVGGLTPDEVDGQLRTWIEEGLIVVPDNGEVAHSGDDEKPETPSGRGSGVEADVEPGLDLPVELQRQILEFDATLNRPYHQLLGVARDAESSEIKRAYFALSKQYHPDRYFRIEIGDFGIRLDRIFKKIVEAYELLSDPATRSEIARSIQESPPPTTEAADAEGSPTTAPQVPDRLDRLRRIRRRFRLPPKILAERRFHARQFYTAATVSMKRERWIEAAASVRLAIAFDPWCDEYKQAFSEIQSHVHRVRAAQLLQEAKGAFDDSAKQEALRLYEEALAFQPRDEELNAQAAGLALELAELDRAREYAEIACEVSPENKEHHVMLARVYRKQGLADRAMDALEAANRIDPKDDSVRAEMDSLRRRGRRGMTGGKK